MTEQDLNQAEADAAQAAKEEERALTFLKSMKPEQKEIQKRKKEFEKMRANPEISPEDVWTERAKLNSAIAEYNKRRQEAESRYAAAKEKAKELREKVESLRAESERCVENCMQKIKQQRREVEKTSNLNENADPEENYAEDLGSDICLLVHCSLLALYENPEINWAFEEYKCAQENTRAKQDKYEAALREEEKKRMRVVELAFQKHLSSHL